MGSQCLSYVNSERVLFQICFFLMLPEEKGIGERTSPQIILGLLTMEKCKYRIRLLSCKTLLFSRLVSMPARRMVKGRADERAEGAFRDSRGLLNWCCPFKCSKSLLYQPGLCTYTVTGPRRCRSMCGSTATFVHPRCLGMYEGCWLNPAPCALFPAPGAPPAAPGQCWDTGLWLMGWG